MTIDVWMVWIIIAIVLFIVELITPGTFFFFCIGVGAVVAAVFSVLPINQVITWIVFFVVSIILIVISRPIVKRLNKEKTRDANVDDLVGQKAKVTEVIDSEGHPGMVKIKGEVWLAKSDEKIEVGEDVNVLNVEGNYLRVEKVKSD